MPRKKRLIDKKATKHSAKKCYFCEEDDYALLDCHRIIEGANGGEYTDFNTVVVCSNCHRRVHDGQIAIDRKYFSTTGGWVLHYFKDGEEFWD